MKPATFQLTQEGHVEYLTGFLSAPEAGELLGVTAQTIGKWCKEKGLPHLIICGRRAASRNSLWFRERAVRRWAKQMHLVVRDVEFSG